MENIKKKALDYLQSKPNINEIFSTEDGFLFEKKQDAINHAKSIGDKENPKVEIHTREIPPLKLPKAEISEIKDKKPSPAELKVIKDKKVAEYIEVFGEEPNPKLSASELEKLIDEKRKEVVDNSAEQNTETLEQGNETTEQDIETTDNQTEQDKE